jgi:hypothetical protein
VGLVPGQFLINQVLIDRELKDPTMKTLIPTPLRVALLFCFVSGLLLGTAAFALEEEAEDFLAMNSISAVQIQAVSTEGTEILARIAAARGAIQANNLQKARFEAAKARTLLQDVRYKSPAVRLQDKIERAIGLARGSKLARSLVEATGLQKSRLSRPPSEIWQAPEPPASRPRWGAFMASWQRMEAPWLPARVATSLPV